MVELIGDLCAPSELIVPVENLVAANQPTMSGAAFISGALMFFVDTDGTRRKITSA